MADMDFDKFMAALCIWREARGTTEQAMAAIYWVLMNRVADPRWPNTLEEVVTQPYQFSSFNTNDPNAVKLPSRRNKTDWTAFQSVLHAIDGATSIGGDPTQGANHYESCEPGKLPAWAQQSKLTVQIGPFRFYKL